METLLKVFGFGLLGVVACLIYLFRNSRKKNKPTVDETTKTKPVIVFIVTAIIFAIIGYIMFIYAEEYGTGIKWFFFPVFIVVCRIALKIAGAGEPTKTPKEDKK